MQPRATGNEVWSTTDEDIPLGAVAVQKHRSRIHRMISHDPACPRHPRCTGVLNRARRDLGVDPPDRPGQDYDLDPAA